MDCQHTTCPNAATVVAAGGCLEQQHILTYYYCDEHAKVIKDYYEAKDLYCSLCQQGAASKYTNPRPIAELLMQQL